MASSSLQFSTTLSSLIHPKSPSSSSSLIKLSPKTLSFPLSFSLSKSYPFQLRTRFNRTQSINSLIVRAVRKLAESDPLPVSSEPGSEFPNGSGVYGVYDANGDLQFIGISRNIAASIATHKKLVPELCSSVKVGVVEGSTPDRTVLTDAWKSWMEEHIATSGKVPPGNEKGNTTWVRQPQKKANIRLTPGRHVQLTVPLEDLIDRLVKEKEVVAFIKGSRTSPQCGFSQRVVGILESHGVDFECVDVLDEEYNFGLRETLKKYSNWPTFPQVFVKGELLGGCDIISDMAAKGELVTLFKK